MQAEIVAIGTELLLGQIVDTNSAHIAQQLTTIGLNLYYKTVVGDNEKRIRAVLERAHQNSRVVITTGGIGPTVDDMTRQVVADVMGVKLEFHQHLMDHIEAIFRRSAYKMSEGNRRQAYIPAGATILENPRGTAPGFIAEDEKGMICSLPGVPHEMKHMMEAGVIPHLKQRLGLKEIIKYRVLRTIGIGESTVDDRIKDLMVVENPTVGLLAGAGMVRVRVAAKADSEAEADRMIWEMEEEIRRRLGDYVYGVGEEEVETVVSRLLQEKGKSFAVTETVTGGLICRRFSLLPHHASFLKDGMLAISPRARRMLLDAAGAGSDATDDVTAQSAAHLAEGIRKISGADIGLAVESGYRPEMGDHIVGSTPIYLAISDGKETRHRDITFGGGAGWIQQRSSNLAIDLLRRYLIGNMSYD